MRFLNPAATLPKHEPGLFSQVVGDTSQTIEGRATGETSTETVGV